MRKAYITGSIIGIILLASCHKEDLNPMLNVQVPNGFPQPVYQFEGNQPTQKGFDLGKKLFYDPGLSADATVSCGTCHQQFAGFANLDHATSHGVDNCFGTRNAPVLFNLIWKDNFFLDGGAKNIEVSPLNALTNQCEMANDIPSILSYLKSKPDYQHDFYSAFGSSEINSQKMLQALAQFMGMMVSANSKYDQVKAGKTSFTEQEQNGYLVFQQKCASCHKEPLFTDNSFRNNGLDIISADTGRARITTLSSDFAKFKVPTLRNIEVSRPYMHDGRFKTLEEVLNHYQSGILLNPNLDEQLKNGLSLSNKDKANIILFLKTLTDHEFLKNTKFSEE